MELEKNVQYIKGVGPKTSMLFNKLNIFTIKDLLNHFPRAYEDRSIIKPIYSLKEGDTASVIGEVYIIDKGRYTKSGKYMTRIALKNDTGIIVGVWFNQRFIKNNFKTGEKYLFYGRVSVSFGEKQIINPEYEKIDEDIKKGILPIYPSTQNLSQKSIRNALYRILYSDDFKLNETLPDEILRRYDLLDIESAYKNIHFPDDKSKIYKAVKRIKFEELLMLQLGLMLEKGKIEKNKGISFKISESLKAFISSLKFELTGAQKKAVYEILNDMKSERQMNRLIQGDVGCGKTIVAAIALFNAAKNGYQAAMMAPTEILAEQHFESLSSLFKGFEIKVEMLSGKLSKNEKDEIKKRLVDGEIDVLVGTHAVIQEDVEFNNLGLVITDEQHRFGVRQRAKLNLKGNNPDVLVMTATPIPRTMALFIYGDLDISIIDELPPGRQKIDTYAVKPDMKKRVYNFVKKEITSGRQAYIVCPLIEESDVFDAESATKTAEMLEREYLKGVRIGLLHGRMKPDEKDEVMLKFKNGNIDVLVCTTVIEVGINIPNATVMVIESADRFGLAQLHQLRGRVGRGSNKSYCILISEMNTEESKMRMKVMQDLSDGFKIAEKDMEIRGTGEFFGTMQHGMIELKLADLFKDAELLKTANDLAKELIVSEKIYNNSEYDNLINEVNKKFVKKDESIAFN